MDGPYSLQRAMTEEEEEYQQTLHTMLHNEEVRLEANRYLDGDILGLDDGRPGIGWGSDGPTFGWQGYIVLHLIGLALVVMLVLWALHQGAVTRDTSAQTPSPATTSRPLAH